MVSIGLEGLGARVDRVALLFCHQVAELLSRFDNDFGTAARRIPNDHFCSKIAVGDAGTDEFQQLGQCIFRGLQSCVWLCILIY